MEEWEVWLSLIRTHFSLKACTTEYLPPCNYPTVHLTIQRYLPWPWQEPQAGPVFSSVRKIKKKPHLRVDTGKMPRKGSGQTQERQSA